MTNIFIVFFFIVLYNKQKGQIARKKNGVSRPRLQIIDGDVWSATGMQDWSMHHEHILNYFVVYY